MSKIIKPAAPALILPDRGIHPAMMEQPCQQQQAHFGVGFISGKALSLVTLNPADKFTGVVLSNGNLTVNAPVDTIGLARATAPKTVPSASFQITINAIGSRATFGLGLLGSPLDNWVGNSPNQVGYSSDGYFFKDGSVAGTGASATTGDVLKLTYNGTTVTFFKNGASIGSQSYSGTLYPLVGGVGTQSTADFSDWL